MASKRSSSDSGELVDVPGVDVSRVFWLTFLVPAVLFVVGRYSVDAMGWMPLSFVVIPFIVAQVIAASMYKRRGLVVSFMWEKRRVVIEDDAPLIMSGVDKLTVRQSDIDRLELFTQVTRTPVFFVRAKLLVYLNDGTCLDIPGRGLNDAWEWLREKGVPIKIHLIL